MTDSLFPWPDPHSLQAPPHNPHAWRMIPVIGKALVAEGMDDDPRQDVPDG